MAYAPLQGMPLGITVISEVLFNFNPLFYIYYFKTLGQEKH